MTEAEMLEAFNTLLLPLFPAMSGIIEVAVTTVMGTPGYVAANFAAQGYLRWHGPGSKAGYQVYELTERGYKHFNRSRYHFGD